MLKKEANLDIKVLQKVLEERKDKQIKKCAFSNKIILSSVDQKKIKKIAFDLYEFEDKTGIWQLEKDAIDGKEYLVREKDDKDIEEKDGWNATEDSKSEVVTLSYKKTPVLRYNAEEYGFNKESVKAFKKLLIEKVASDNFIIDTFRQLSKEERKVIFVENKELSRFAEAKLYDVSPQPAGEADIKKAHPETVNIVPSAKEGGVVENIIEQQQKDMQVVNQKFPSIKK